MPRGDRSTVFMCSFIVPLANYVRYFLCAPFAVTHGEGAVCHKNSVIRNPLYLNLVHAVMTALPDLDGYEAQIVYNAHAVAVGKRKYFGDSSDSLKRARRDGEPIRAQWIQNPASIPAAAAAFLLESDTHDRKMLRRIGLLEAVEASLLFPPDAQGHIGTPATVSHGSLPFGYPNPSDATSNMPDVGGDSPAPSHMSWSDESMTESGADDSNGAVDASDVDLKGGALNISDVLNSSEVDVEAAVQFASSSDVDASASVTTNAASYKQILQDWAVRFKVPKSAVTGLLESLKKHEPQAVDYAALPTDARQLLKV